MHDWIQTVIMYSNANYNFMCPRYNRETEGVRTSQVHGARLWNGIPLEIRKKGAIGSFISAMKKHFLA